MKTTKKLRSEANETHSELAKAQTLAKRRKNEFERLSIIVKERCKFAKNANMESKEFRKLCNETQV